MFASRPLGRERRQGGGGGSNRAGRLAARVCDSSGSRREHFPAEWRTTEHPPHQGALTAGWERRKQCRRGLQQDCCCPAPRSRHFASPGEPCRQPSLHSIAYGRAQGQPLSSFAPLENKQLCECDLGWATVATGHTAALAAAPPRMPQYASGLQVGAACQLSIGSSDQCYMVTELLRFVCGKVQEQSGAAMRLTIQGRPAQCCVQHGDGGMPKVTACPVRHAPAGRG